MPLGPRLNDRQPFPTMAKSLSVDVTVQSI
jgi:hypothetical protein